ncbi:TPA: hypothetical protein QCS32_005309 [Bacillus thuringiensis]|uniref:Uncharacterized protein n=1 Tax=Bacillus thuringiensis serovar iberica TaxID=180866 RepID=A0A9X6LFW4_BACTU|nr:hypothetical protein [Bacillus thuringiensis]MEB9625224.1 hypothetical protein [Bacillus cereus]OUB44888.1 hypothetical protein BK741_21690 [Bacillus thuringiensis serovar iberica]HDR5353539.1 hypothetical protein [Bacillus thuringiensis]
MFTRKQAIPFRSFMDRSYKDKIPKIRKYNSISPLAFLHISDQMINTYLALGVIGTVLIGAVLLEKYLVKNDHVAASKFVSDGIYHGTRIGGVCFIGYVFIRIVMMF